jgi:predicted regulator of Ras-like GTPase activity (Roadblock/LC7/MglB family)
MSAAIADRPRGVHVLDQILNDLISAVKGASAAIFVDGDGESIVQAGDSQKDIRLLGAWKELHLDRIKEITTQLGLGSVQAVLLSLDEGNEVIAPVGTDYCLVLFMSSYSDIRQAMTEMMKAIALLKKEIE